MRTATIFTILAYYATTLSAYPKDFTQALIEVEIQDQLSFYAQAIDRKDYGILSNFYTENAVVNYSLPSGQLLHGLAEIEQALTVELDNIVTQHNIGTVLVDFIEPDIPNSTAYLVANYLGQGNLTGQVLVFYGMYKDQWILEGGRYKSRNSTLSLFPPGAIGYQAIAGL